MSGQRMIIMNAGSSYFEHVENYYGSNACEQNSCRNAEMPAELKTEKAQRIKNNLIEIGVVTENFMPSGRSLLIISSKNSTVRGSIYTRSAI